MRLSEVCVVVLVVISVWDLTEAQGEKRSRFLVSSTDWSLKSLTLPRLARFLIARI